ncbi:nucleoside-diphosphate sugar epimerase [Bacillus sp. OR9]|nr:nucleoside-diphosphate sugar epimerase [Bacillus sp. OR9]
MKKIEVTAGRGRTSFIDVRDIGEVAAKVLTEAGDEFQSYDLTGSKALTYYEVAEIISKEMNEQPITILVYGKLEKDDSKRTQT